MTPRDWQEIEGIYRQPKEDWPWQASVAVMAACLIALYIIWRYW